MCFPPGSRWVALAYLCTGKDIHATHKLVFTQKVRGSSNETQDYPLSVGEKIHCGRICDLLAEAFDNGFSEDPELIERVDALFSPWIHAGISVEEEAEEEEAETGVEAADLDLVVPSREQAVQQQMQPAGNTRLRPEWLTGAVDTRRDTSKVTKQDLKQWGVHHNLNPEDYMNKGHYRCPDCGEKFKSWIKVIKPSLLGHFYNTRHGISNVAPGSDAVPDIAPATTSLHFTSFGQRQGVNWGAPNLLTDISRVGKQNLKQFAVHHNLEHEMYLIKGRYRCPDCEEKFKSWMKVTKPSLLGHFYNTRHGISNVAPGSDPVPDIAPATTTPYLTPSEQRNEDILEDLNLPTTITRSSFDGSATAMTPAAFPKSFDGSGNGLGDGWSQGQEQGRGQGQGSGMPTEHPVGKEGGRGYQCGTCHKTFEKPGQCLNHMQCTRHEDGIYKMRQCVKIYKMEKAEKRADRKQKAEMLMAAPPAPVISPPASAPLELVLPTKPMAVRLREAKETNDALAKRVADLEAALSLTAKKESDEVDDRKSEENAEETTGTLAGQERPSALPPSASGRPYSLPLPAIANGGERVERSLPSPMIANGGERVERAVGNGSGNKIGMVSHPHGKGGNECSLN